MQPGSSSHRPAPAGSATWPAACSASRPRSASSSTRTVRSPAPSASWPRTGRRSLGVLGLLPDDARLFRSFELAEESGLEVEFAFTKITESLHPNAVRFVLTGKDGLMVTLVGDSTGGGMVETVTLRFPYGTIGDAWVLLVQDPLEALSPEDLERLRAGLPSVLGAQSVRAEGRGALHVVELPAEPDLAGLDDVLAGAFVRRVALLRRVLPVVSRLDRKPQLFDTMTRWRELMRELDLPLWEVAVRYQTDASGWPEYSSSTRCASSRVSCGARRARCTRKTSRSSTPSSSRTSPAGG